MSGLKLFVGTMLIFLVAVALMVWADSLIVGTPQVVEKQRVCILVSGHGHGHRK
jgi:hypothetical protein